MAANATNILSPNSDLHTKTLNTDISLSVSEQKKYTEDGHSVFKYQLQLKDMLISRLRRDIKNKDEEIAKLKNTEIADLKEEIRKKNLEITKLEKKINDRKAKNIIDKINMQDKNLQLEAVREEIRKEKAECDRQIEQLKIKLLSIG